MRTEHSSRLVARIAAALPLLLAALLALAAVGTVGEAGCDEPGYYVDTPGGITFVSGCHDPGAMTPLPGDQAAAKDPVARRG